MRSGYFITADQRQQFRLPMLGDIAWRIAK
jgi:uncharacterized membrane protein